MRWKEAERLMRSVRYVQHHEVAGSGIYVAGFILFIVLWYALLRPPAVPDRDCRLMLAP